MWLTSKNQLTLCKGHYSQYCGWALSNQLKGFMREKLRFLKEEEILPQDCNIKSTQLPWWLSHKESVCQCRSRVDLDLIPESGRYPGGENGNPLQYSCLENAMDREAGGLQSMGSQRIGHD